MVNPISSLPHDLLPAIHEAGEAALEIYRAPFAVERKEDGSRVTAADRNAEAIILRALGRIAPDIPVIAEESFSTGRNGQKLDGSGKPFSMEQFFLVDPIDGTADFINRTDEFTVNIALIEHHRPVLGLIYAPVFNRLWIGDPIAKTALRVDEVKSGDSACLDRAVAISTRQIPADNRIALISHSAKGGRTEQLLTQHKATEIRRVGSSLKFCYLAEGQADFYPRPGRTMLWDTAAGQAILEAAGGRVLALAAASPGEDETAKAGPPLGYDISRGWMENPDFIAWARR